MRKRQDLIESIRDILDRAGFTLSDRHSVESICFDVIARRGDLLLIIKVLVNIDAIKRETTDEMRTLATTLRACPIIIGNASSGGKLEQGSIYSRFMIPIMTKETFYDFLIEEVPPYIFAAPGGFYVRLDGDVLKHLRGMRNLSLGTLAEVAGVSRRTIQLYCDGAGATIEAAMKIEKFLGIPLIVPLDPFKYTESTVETLKTMDDMDNLEKDVFKHLTSLGYDVLPTIRCPFEALTRDRKNIFLTGIERENRRIAAKARAIGSISTIVRRQSVIFIEQYRVHSDNIEGTPVIGNDELRMIKEPERVLSLIDERRKGRKEGR